MKRHRAEGWYKYYLRERGIRQVSTPFRELIEKFCDEELDCFLKVGGKELRDTGV
jgi:hypothetical protein